VTPGLKLAPNVTVPDVCVNNGVVIVPPLNVNAVAVTKLVVVVILCPLVIVTVPLTVYVGQVIVVRFTVPAGANKLVSPVSELVQVKLNVAKSIVPAVLVKVVQLTPLTATVVVPALLIVNAAIVFALVVIVPVPLIVGFNEVYVPVLDNVRLLRFNMPDPGLNEVVPKSSVLNQLAVVGVPVLAPVVNVKFGALVVVPPAVAPKLNVLVLLIAATVNPPVPVQVKLVAVAMLNTVVAVVVCDNAIDPVPKVIARVLVLSELNVPVVNVIPVANVNVPAVSVYVPVAVNE